MKLRCIITLALCLLLVACHPGTSRQPLSKEELAAMDSISHPSKDDLKARLSPEQFRVTQEGGTEAPFTGKYWNTHADGSYTCVVCGIVLFQSEAKFDSGCGWPSFFAAENERVKTREDRRHGMVRQEIVCAKCEAHLGHVFEDGPQPTGLRYCVNSASLDFEEKDQ